jgi:hypothetical protein
MSGASVLYVWEPKSWIFITILSVGMVFTILLIPLSLGLIHHYTDSTLHHFSDKIFEYYCANFFVLNSVPKFFHNKLMTFFFLFTILIFMSIYTGKLTDEFFRYKNFDGILVKEDLIGRKGMVFYSYVQDSLSIGSKYLKIG